MSEPVTVKDLRGAAIEAGFRALEGRLPEEYGIDHFLDALASWDVKAFCRGEEVVGMLMLKANELHVAVLPHERGKWLSRRLIRDVIGPLLERYGFAKTSVSGDNEKGRDFVSRIGFNEGCIHTLRDGFARGTFDPVTAIIAGGATLLGSALSANAAKKAASQQAGAANQASETQLRMFNTLNEQGAPYRQAGVNALNTISEMQPQFTHSFNAEDLKTNLAPNYQFQLDQGLGAVKNASNLQTGLLSGNTLKGINDYAQNFAGNAYQQAFNNYNAQQTNIFNRLSSIAGLGQTQNQTTAQSGTTAAGNIGQAQIGAGAAQAAGTVGAANALSGGLTNAASWYALPKFLTFGGGGGDSSLIQEMVPGQFSLGNPAYG